MNKFFTKTILIASCCSMLLLASFFSPSQATGRNNSDFKVYYDAFSAIRKGREAFRYDTFGNEAFWTDRLRLNEVIAGESLGGIGGGISPATALSVGIKVDVNALPRRLQYALRRGKVDLDDPATTLQLLQLGAVIGLQGKVDQNGGLQSIGVTCALCHSTVDDSFAPGIGRRLDGWANRDVNAGLIISLAPDLSVFTDLVGINASQDQVRAVLQTWGAGRFDAGLVLDGITSRPDGKPSSVLIPRTFGLSGVNLHTWTGWGSVSHWNALVANLELGGQGTFFDPRLNDAIRFPIAAANGFGDVRPENDLVTSKLADLNLYQLALKSPKPPRNSFDRYAAKRGKELFSGQADCARCHVPPLFTEPGWNLHTAEEIGIDDFQAQRAPDGRYRTAPLKGIWTTTTGGFFHDGRFPTLLAVVDHYNTVFNLDLNENQKSDLVEYLKSL